MTGFSGSAGTAVITKDGAGLWTDGRYFVQAGKQLEGTGVTLQKMGQPEVPEIGEYLEQVLPEGGCLGFDGRVINCQLGQELENLLSEKNVTLAYQTDLVDVIWKERPQLSAEPAWILEEKYGGKSSAQKIEELRSQMKKEKATIHILTTLDDIAWILGAGFVSLLLSGRLSVLALGEESAAGLGVNIWAVRLTGIVVVLILAGASVSLVGGISFLGLIVPHIARFLAGEDYGRLLPISALLGAILLVLADIAARTINAPFDTPVGALVSAIGVPVFLALTYQKKGAIL